MANQPVVSAIVEAITSTEALAAFLGAFAAFLLEALRRWHSDRLATLAAGNEAIFFLSQMFAHITNINNQYFVERAVEVREIMKREPNYLEFLPMEAGTEDVVRVPTGRLGFLLGTYDPDLLNRLAAADREFGVLMKLMEQRNAAHVQWQQASAVVNSQIAAGAPIPLGVLEEMVGIDLSYRLRHMTESLQTRLPGCADNLKSAGGQLAEVLSLTFPIGRVNKFVVRERPNAVAPLVGGPKPRPWRRVVRSVARLARKPLRSSTKVSKARAGG